MDMHPANNLHQEEEATTRKRCKWYGGLPDSPDDSTQLRTTERDVMNYEKAADIWRQIGVSQLGELRLDLIRSAISYSNCRVQWWLASQEQRIEMDRGRSAAHTVFIDACNIMSRNMAKAGESIEWREILGDDRKEIGDFACFIVLFLGVAAR